MTKLHQAFESQLLLHKENVTMHRSGDESRGWSMLGRLRRSLQFPDTD